MAKFYSKKDMIIAIQDTCNNVIKPIKFENKEQVMIEGQLLCDDIENTFGIRVPYIKGSKILKRFEAFIMKYGDLFKGPLY